MSITSDSVASLSTDLNSFAEIIDKLIDAKASDENKLEEAYAEIENLKTQIGAGVDDETTAQQIDQLAETLKAVAAKALAASSASAGE